MSNKIDKALLKIRDFVWDSDVDCGEDSCPLEDICGEATNRELSCGLCSEADSRFLEIIKEIGKDE